MIALYTRHIFT